MNVNMKSLLEQLERGLKKGDKVNADQLTYSFHPWDKDAISVLKKANDLGYLIGELEFLNFEVEGVITKINREKIMSDRWMLEWFWTRKSIEEICQEAKKTTPSITEDDIKQCLDYHITELTEESVKAVIGKARNGDILSIQWLQDRSFMKMPKAPSYPQS